MEQKELSERKLFMLELLFTVLKHFGGSPRIRRIVLLSALVLVLSTSRTSTTGWLHYGMLVGVSIYALLVVADLALMLVLTFLLHILDSKWSILQSWWRYCFVQRLHVEDMRERIRHAYHQEQLEYEVAVSKEKLNSARERAATQRFVQAYNKQAKRLRTEKLWLLIPPALQSRMQTLEGQGVGQVGQAETQLLADVRAAVERAAKYKGQYDRAVEFGVATAYLEFLHAGYDGVAAELLQEAASRARLLSEARAFNVPVVLESMGQSAYRTQLAKQIEAARRFLSRQRILSGLEGRIALLKEPAVRAPLENLLTDASTNLPNEREFKKIVHRIEAALAPKVK